MTFGPDYLVRWILALETFPSSRSPNGQGDARNVHRTLHEPTLAEPEDRPHEHPATLDISNRLYDSAIGAYQYDRYLDEKIYAEGEPGLSAEGLG